MKEEENRVWIWKGMLQHDFTQDKLGGKAVHMRDLAPYKIFRTSNKFTYKPDH